jgi:hypothetical protein
MDPEPPTKLSRRDAIKLLGAAAGASVLANLPSKWSTPQLAAGVLPAHAQTSELHSLSCDDLLQTLNSGTLVTGAVHVSPVASGILLHYHIVLTNLTTVHSLNGNVPTDAAGQALVDLDVLFAPGTPHTVDIAWSFVNPSDGTSTCSTSLDVGFG